MRLEVSHVTRYQYAAPVRMSTQYLRLTPRDSSRQKVLAWKLEAPGAATRTTDGYGNILHVLTLDTPVSEIQIRVTGTVETRLAYYEGAETASRALRASWGRSRRSTAAASIRPRAWATSPRRS